MDKPTQPRLWNEDTAMAIVNVATIPLRSPFRYPGGKTWLVPHVRRWLTSMPTKPERLVEPFAGGAIIGLTAVFENLVGCVTLVEIDPDVASVWGSILNGAGGWLADEITRFPFSGPAVHSILAAQPSSPQERAFAALLRNRVSRGGIAAPGAGLVKRGENGRGLASRWYPETLSRRIRDIVALKERIEFISGDGLEVMRCSAESPNTAFFIDPPYTIAGRRLYRYSEVDHSALFQTAADLAGPVLMTYDDTDEIRLLADRHGFEWSLVPMKNTHHRLKCELIISRDLGWLLNPHD